MKIYLIHPVRKASSRQLLLVESYVKQQEEEGHKVFFPLEDTPQGDETGYQILQTEYRAIKDADEVHVFWDKESKGSHFDLGMAFALRKRIVMVHHYQADKPGKTYWKAMARHNSIVKLIDEAR